MLVPTQEEEERLKETKSRDAKALFNLQQAVHDIVFSRIAASTTSKEAWSILQTEFQGGSKVIVVKLQALRRDFETLSMNNAETIADFLSRAMSIVSQMRSYGEQISDETIVAKVLRSLTSKFDHVVVAIEESKDLSVLSVDELMGSLQAHESRINRSLEKNEEKAFQVKETTNKYGENYNSTINIRGEKGFRNRDSGCSYHMTGTKSLFQELDETQKIQVQLGNKMEMQVEGKGTIGINTDRGQQVHIGMTPNKMFSLDVSTMENFALVANAKDDSELWHLRYGHLNVKGLKLLSDKATDSPTTATNASVSATPSRDPPSSTALEESSEETPPRKYRSLTDIYASCQFALNDPRYRYPRSSTDTQGTDTLNPSTDTPCIFLSLRIPVAKLSIDTQGEYRYPRGITDTLRGSTGTLCIK
ncbi:hypothetical protein GQ457_04G016030 [Hibiscus cannabinus]